MFNEVFTLTLDRSFGLTPFEEGMNDMPPRRYQVRMALGHVETDEHRIDAIRRIFEQVLNLYRKDNGIIGGPEDDAKGKMLMGAIKRLTEPKPKKAKAEPKKEEPKRKLEEIIPL